MLLKKRYKHFGRFKEVVNTLARHGFGFIIDQLGLSELVLPSLRGRKKVTDKTEKISLAKRLRLVLEELGPTAVKLGQVLSTRADLLPKDIIAELAKLQDDVPPFPFEQVKEQVEKELGQPLEYLFARFEPKPLAAASIGQVHYARLSSGMEVVVKVQRPGVEEVIRTDLDILRDVARLAQKHTSWGELYNFVEIAEEFARTIKEEMDYYAEGRNAEIFRENFANDHTVHIPSVYWNYTTARILTLEYISGCKLNNAECLEKKHYSRHTIAVNVANAFLRMVLMHGFFHADPHPGNIAVLPDEVIAFMDFGMVGRISEERKEEFINLALGLIGRNSSKIINAILKMGVLSEETDLNSLRLEVERMRERYYNLPFSKINLGAAVQEILDLAYKYRIRIPSEFTLLAKALLTLEGVVQELDPELSIMVLAEPFGRELFRKKYSPGNIGKHLSEVVEDYGEIALALPKRIDHILSKLEEGKLSLKLEHQNIEKALNRADRISNKLTFAIVLLSFSIVMSGLIIGSAIEGDTGGFFLWRLPILEVGFGAASMMFLWLILAILRSGRF